MAIVKTVRTSNGAIVQFDDSAYAGISEEELKRRIEHMESVARRIVINAELRRIQEEKGAVSEK